MLYRNELKNWEFGKKQRQHLYSERVTIAQGQGASENVNVEANAMQPKTNFSIHFGISAPSELYHVQKWFASRITLPIEEDLEEETLFVKKQESMAIYRRLYWNRLFNFFYTAFPFLTRLFGFQGMKEKIVTPYLLKYPPQHWCLHQVSYSLVKWIEEEYFLKDKKLILEAAKLDEAHGRLFLAKQEPIPIASSSEELFLQPYVELFIFDCDLVRFREHFLTKSVEYWEENPFPSLIYDQPHYFMIYRSLKEGMVYEEIGAVPFQLLTAFKQGSSLEKAIDGLDGDEKELERDLPLWLYHWATLQLLSTHNGVVR